MSNMNNYARLLFRLLAEEHDDHGDDHDHADEFAAETLDLHDDHDDDKPWGGAIGAAFLIQGVTLIGLIVSIFMTALAQRRSAAGGNEKKFLHFLAFQVIPSFAAGALLATAVFLVIPESLALLGGGHSDHEEEGAEEAADHDDAHHGHDHFLLRRALEEDHHNEEPEEPNETEASWKFGAALLGGFLFPILLHVLFPTQHAHGDGAEPAVVVEGSSEAEQLTPASAEGQDEEDPDKKLESSDSDDGGAENKNGEENNDETEKGQDATTVPTDSDSSGSVKPIDWTLASSILVGDFLHNFTDGVFVGTAFLLCDTNVAWTIVASTVYHELAQEIADFALLHHHCGFSKLVAVLYNFVSGFSVVLGAILVLSMDMSETAQGTTLAIAAGVYIYIAACECIPRIQAVRRTSRDTLVFLVMFILGAVPIGLVLLNHKHCEEGHAH